MSARQAYNAYILKRTLELLQHDDSNGLMEAFNNTCYLAEQAIKSEIHEQNPLLYYDLRSLSSPRQRAVIVTGEMPPDRARSVQLNEAIPIFLEITKKEDEQLLEEMRISRNDLMHSIMDMTLNPASAGDIAAQLLLNLKPYLGKVCGMEKNQIDIVTYRELQARQKQLEKKATDDLHKAISDHHKLYISLKPDVIAWRRDAAPSFNSPDIFISSPGPLLCPACNEQSLDEITAVDFDWNPDGVMTTGSTWYVCRVCELELSTYDFIKVSAP